VVKMVKTLGSIEKITLSKLTIRTARDKTMTLKLETDNLIDDAICYFDKECVFTIEAGTIKQIEKYDFTNKEHYNLGQETRRF